jgi:hypothetical protein
MFTSNLNITWTANFHFKKVAAATNSNNAEETIPKFTKSEVKLMHNSRSASLMLVSTIMEKKEFTYIAPPRRPTKTMWPNCSPKGMKRNCVWQIQNKEGSGSIQVERSWQNIKIIMRRKTTTTTTTQQQRETTIHTLACANHKPKLSPCNRVSIQMRCTRKHVTVDREINTPNW